MDGVCPVETSTSYYQAAAAELQASPSTDVPDRSRDGFLSCRGFR